MNPTSLAEPATLSPTEWEVVHAKVQSIFDGLTARVRARCPMVEVQSGKTSGRAFFLYSYRSFAWPEEGDGESVVAGITFTPSPEGSGVCLTADIGGEETGCIDYEVPERVVPADLATVLAATHEFAEELSRQDEVVANALAERRPPPNYRKGAR